MRLGGVAGFGLVVLALPSWLVIQPPAVLSQTDCGGLRLEWILPNPTQGREQVKIINTGSELVDLSTWRLDDQEGGSRPTNLSGTLPAGESLIIQLSSAVFNNSGDKVRLICNNQVIDETGYASAPKGSYWAKDQAGTWCWVESEPDSYWSCPVPTSTPTPTLTPVPTAFVHPQAGCVKLLISRVLPAPESGAGERVKVYNPHRFQVTLDNWQLDDSPDQASPVSLSGMLAPEGEVEVKLNSAMFNNSGDQVRLICAAEVVDVIEYDKAIKGQIILRDQDNNLCWRDFNYWQVEYTTLSCLSGTTPTPTPLVLTGQSVKSQVSSAPTQPAPAGLLLKVFHTVPPVKARPLNRPKSGWPLVFGSWVVGLYLRRRFKS